MFELANIVMLFLLAVVFVAVRYGRGPAVMAAFLTVARSTFFYVPPRFTFSVSDAQYLLTFAVMLVVALVIGQMTAGLKFQARVATLREERVRALYEMSRDLSGALLPSRSPRSPRASCKSEFEARAALMVADLTTGVTQPVPSPTLPAGIDPGIAQWAFDHDEAAGARHQHPAGLADPLSAAEGADAHARRAGDRAAQCRRGWPARSSAACWTPARRCSRISLERIHYVDVAQSTTVQMESERLRNSLLAAISHDLRTPLAALVGMADSLAMTQPAADGRRRPSSRARCARPRCA